MLIFELDKIGNRLLTIRKNAGLTQAEVAEAAGLSDRAYADIERGTANMRVESLMKICDALRITPNDILVKEDLTPKIRLNDIAKRIENCCPSEQERLIRILEAFFTGLTSDK